MTGNTTNWGRSPLILLFAILLINFSIALNHKIPYSIQQNGGTQEQIRTMGVIHVAWNTTWGCSWGDGGSGIALDSAVNIYTVGLTTDAGYYNDLAVVKFNKDGNQVWNATWGTSITESGSGIALDSAGNIYTVGTIFDGMGGYPADFAVVKFYPNGTKAWNQTWGGGGNEWGNGIALDSAGNVYAVGQTNSYGLGSSDFAVVKFYSNGTKAWNTTWGGPQADGGIGIALDIAGSLYAVGFTESFGAASTDLALVKFYPNGTRVWNTTWGGSKEEDGRSLALDSAGNIYINGLTGSFGAGSFDLALVKFDPNGARVWNISWGGILTDWGQGITLGNDGNIYIIGVTRSYGAGAEDLVLIKVNSNGIIAWVTTWGGSKDDSGSGIALDSAGNIYAVGQTYNFGAGATDLLLLKFTGDSGGSSIPGFLSIPILIGLLLLPLILKIKSKIFPQRTIYSRINLQSSTSVFFFFLVFILKKNHN